MDDDGEGVLRDVVRVAEAALGDRLAALYPLGSLAHGGFRPLVSDVDAAMVLTDPPRPDDAEPVQGVGDTVRGLGLHRLCLVEHGRLQSMDEPELADGFGRWRSRLLDAAG